MFPFNNDNFLSPRLSTRVRPAILALSILRMTKKNLGVLPNFWILRCKTINWKFFVEFSKVKPKQLLAPKEFLETWRKQTLQKFSNWMETVYAWIRHTNEPQEGVLKICSLVRLFASYTNWGGDFFLWTSPDIEILDLGGILVLLAYFYSTWC